jgi:mRNA-degrading endonuclease RelE of RelBE toxin-antitoxin system
MSRYVFVFSQIAEEQIAALDTVTRKRLGKKLQYFLDSGQPLTFAIQLVNVTPPIYRFRIGKYRVFFEVDDHKLFVLAVKRRDQAYRNI